MQRLPWALKAARGAGWATKNQPEPGTSQRPTCLQGFCTPEQADILPGRQNQTVQRLRAPEGHSHSSAHYLIKRRRRRDTAHICRPPSILAAQKPARDRHAAVDINFQFPTGHQGPVRQLPSAVDGASRWRRLLAARPRCAPRPGQMVIYQTKIALCSPLTPLECRLHETEGRELATGIEVRTAGNLDSSHRALLGPTKATEPLGEAQEEGRSLRITY